MTNMDCTTCRNTLPELLGAPVSDTPELSAHLASCSACQTEWEALRGTWDLLDEWTAPEPSAYFDTRLYAQLREAQAAEPESAWQHLTSLFRPKMARGLRPAMAGALGLAILLGGGTAATLISHHSGNPAASPTVNDLKIYDNNAQALQQMDLLDDGSPDAQSAPQS